ncbi:MAG: type II toxin-antitoxin system prevent-host-death family antitoxin [Pseudolabrys sp.]|jgi:prevent-host-death family protein
MLTKARVWKLQDAKARFSELVRRARVGQPQEVTLHGKTAVLVVDPQRYEVHPKAKQAETLAGFIEASKKYRGLAEGVEFEWPFPMPLRDKRREIFDGPFDDEESS